MNKNKNKNISKKQQISVVFNYSDIELTKDMEDLLNRGLNFSILSKKLDNTQLQADYKRFERSVIWQEYFFNYEEDVDFEQQIFRSQKTNLPKNYKSPDGLKIFLNSIKSEILDFRNRNDVQCNLPKREIDAMNELVRLQKEKIIVIKECDKGAGIIILNYKDYVKACYEHLLSEKFENGQNRRYYSEVEDLSARDLRKNLGQLILKLESEVCRRSSISTSS